MELTNYGITLRLLTEDKIEMVRQWRNDPKIQQYMEYREEITPEMQKKWFEKLDNGNSNFYFLIVFKEQEIGLINIKDVDYENKSGESGVFIFNDYYLNTDISYRAHLVMFDYIFDVVGLEIIYSHMLKSNKRAQRFGLFLGAHLAPNQENIENQLYIKSKSDYYNNINRKRFVEKFNKMNENKKQ